MGRSAAFAVCTGLVCLAAAATVDAAPRATYFGPGGPAPRAPEIMLYLSHAVGAGAGVGAGGGSMRPTFGLRVQQVRQGANNGDPEQGNPMQHRELINWQMDGRSGLRLSESRLMLGNKVTYDFSNHRFGSPSARSAMQLGTPSLRNASPAQLRPVRSASDFHEIAAAAIAAIAPTRFTNTQRQTAQRSLGSSAIASAQRMQGPTALH